MKCLEMIKHNLDLCEKGDTDYGFVYKSELEEIKFYLEVLEIIYNKKVELELLEYLLVYETSEKILEAYNSNPSRIKLTLEELLKLKQWLEENEWWQQLK